MLRAWLAIVVGACASTPEPARSTQPGALEQRMANCPSALPTAITRVGDLPDGVALTITVTDPAAYERLLELADLHARLGGPAGNAMEHTGRHGGPGSIGHCPIIHAATRVSFERVPEGVRFDVRALPGGDVGELRRQTRARAATLPRFADR